MLQAMTSRPKPVLVVLLSLALSVTAGIVRLRAQATGDVECSPGKACMVVKTNLPLKVLPRPLSNVYQKKDANGPVTESNVPAFQPLYVFERSDIDLTDNLEPKGWYLVGTGSERPLGYMRAVDVIEWRTAMIAAYTHRGTGDNERKPVIMFKDRGSLERLMDGQNPQDAAKALYKRLDASDVPNEIITREPDAYVNISKQFYLLPILATKDMTEQGFEDTRILQIAAAVPNKRADAAQQCTTLRKDFADCIQRIGNPTDEDLTIDVVFVIDFTGSMQNSIDAVKRALHNSANIFASQSKSDQRINFGLISYTDTPESRGERATADNPVVRNFTPQLVPRAQLASILDQFGRVIGPGGDIPEETFAGVLEGINARWRPDSVKLLVLIGDASGHEPSHPQSTTKKDAQTLRLLATEQGVYIATLYIKNPDQATDWAIGQEQFKKLAENPGTAPNFRAVDADPREIENALSEATAEMVERLRKLKADRQKQAPAAQAPAAPKSQNIVVDAFRVALVEFIGRAAEPPRDIQGWVLDKDLTDLRRPAFDIHVLVTRADLDQLNKGVRTIIDAYENSRTSSESFFNSLRAISTTLAVDWNVSSSEVLAKSPYIPKWIESLPYKSEIMSMRYTDFEDKTADQRQQLMAKLKSLVQFYEGVLARPESWVRLHADARHEEHVYPLKLDSLP